MNYCRAVIDKVNILMISDKTSSNGCQIGVFAQEVFEVKQVGSKNVLMIKIFLENKLYLDKLRRNGKITRNQYTPTTPRMRYPEVAGVGFF